MPLKRPVTLAQARRWPAAAKRRESFCARMGGMRELLTGERAARDPDSPINRALAAWDCDKPEGLERKHVSKGVRMKITRAKVGAEARKPAAKNPAKPKGVKFINEAKADKKDDPTWIGYAVQKATGGGAYAIFESKAGAVEYARELANKMSRQMAVVRIRYAVQQ